LSIRKNPFKKHERQNPCRSSSCPPRKNPFRLFRLHPLFLLVGIWYALTGELFLFLLCALVAIQHECAHAFAAAKLGYKLNAIVLMPFGAVIDGDLRGISAKDEIFVAVCGPLCNLLTAVFFVALWWIAPTLYAFTDVACYTSLSIALVNILPAYPLDGGRIFKGLLTRLFLKKHPDAARAERRADGVCRIVTFSFCALFLLTFSLQCASGNPNPSLLFFSVFLLVGALGNRNKAAVYSRLDFSFQNALQRGVEIRRVAVSGNCPIKDVFRFLSRDAFLVLEVYDEKQRRLCEVTQTELSALFAAAKTPYEPLQNLLSAPFPL